MAVTKTFKAAIKAIAFRAKTAFPKASNADDLQEHPGVKSNRLALNQSRTFSNWCNTASEFWGNHVLEDPDKVILVDLLTQDPRVSTRNLTMANAIRRVEGARLVGLIGPDPRWRDDVWDYYDIDALVQLGEAYGITNFVNLAEVADQIADGVTELSLDGDKVHLNDSSLIDDEYIESEAISTALRILRLPKADKETQTDPMFAGIIERSKRYALIYTGLMRDLNVVAFVTSHVDYSTWGFGVKAAMNAQVPIVHVQSTGGLKAYAWFPNERFTGTFRAQLTQQIGEFFSEHIWPNRELLRRPAELTAYRARLDYGRPSWWRASGQLAINSKTERYDSRHSACERLGINPDKPIFAVFAHAMSDALGSNVEVFEDFAVWLTETAAFAEAHNDVTWLFLDHPSQFRYDRTGYFESLADQYSDSPHMLFMPSLDLTKTELWSLVDLAVTVRGSVSNEYPAYGIPAIQAGWSEWSACGVSDVAESKQEFFGLLKERIEQMSRGDFEMTDSQIERARLWSWLYRSATDIDSPLVQHWNIGYSERMIAGIANTMRQVEMDAEPAFTSVMRMWQNREPLLTRIDFKQPEIAQQIGAANKPLPEKPWGNFGLKTAFDKPRAPLSGDIELSSGQISEWSLLAGVVPGVGVICRCDNSYSTLGISYDPQGNDFTVTLKLTVDIETSQWLNRKVREARIPITRKIEVWFRGELQETVQISQVVQLVSRTVSFDVSAPDFPEAGLLIVRLVGAGGEGSHESKCNLSGVRVDSFQVKPKRLGS